MVFFAEQLFNGLQLGMMLFLMSAGLTLILGIMDFLNLNHGSFYMLGAYIGATAMTLTGSFLAGLFIGVALTAVLGMIIEFFLYQRFYQRDHLDQVLLTFALILVLNEGVHMIWGLQPLFLPLPALLDSSVNVFGVPYPKYRLLIIAIGIAVAVFLYWMFTKTRLGMQIRAGADKREMIAALGINIRVLFHLIFGMGIALSALAGVMAGPLLSVQVGMGENILLLAFVTIVIGGIGSVPGALIGALIVGIVDTLSRVYLPKLLTIMIGSGSAASGIGYSLATMSIYILMVIVLLWRPNGLFPAR